MILVNSENRIIEIGETISSSNGSDYIFLGIDGSRIMVRRYSRGGYVNRRDPKEFGLRIKSKYDEEDV